MTNPIAAPAPPVVSPVADLMAGTSKATSPNPNGELGKDAFLKLLVAQLKYQDPSKPVDSSQFMAQTAAFTQVEKLTAMADDSSSALALQQGLAASGLVGRTVSYLDDQGVTREGVVTSASFGGSSTGPVLHIGAAKVPLSGVVAVHSGADTAPDPAAEHTAASHPAATDPTATDPTATDPSHTDPATAGRPA